MYRQWAAMPDLADLVHRQRPDLDLEGLAVDRDDGGVQGLVEVVLGDGDVVVELAGDRAPQRVHDPERRVAVPDLVDEDADGVDVVDLAELRGLALHLLPDAVDVLRAALEVGVDAGGLEPRLELVDRPLDEGLATLAAGVEQLRELAEALRLEGLERQVLQLPLDLPDPEPLGERGVDLEGLARDPELLLRRQAAQGPHVVEAVGELDEDDADVLGHRQEHLPDVLGLLLLVAQRAEPGQLGDAVDEQGDLAPNRSSMSEVLYSVSSGTSWRSSAWMAIGSSRKLVRICAAAIGWVTNGSPVARGWSPCASIANSIARRTGSTSACSSRARIWAMSSSPITFGSRCLRFVAGMGAGGTAGISNIAGVSPGLTTAAAALPLLLTPFRATPFFMAPFAWAGSTVLVVPFALARGCFGGEPSVPSGAARRDPFRAERAAGSVWAGSSARVRGATIVREV